jgi:hypothetical protein
MSALDPETLAKIAAQMNPKLACTDPKKAIELARKLVIAADPELAEQEALRAEEAQLQEETERADKLFPLDQLISVAEAFKNSPGQYKTESRFAAALRKEKLTTEWQDTEVTSIPAVEEFFRRQREAKRKRDRARKVVSNKKPKRISRNPKVINRIKSANKRNEFA